jgi:hypothetical protein
MKTPREVADDLRVRLATAERELAESRDHADEGWRLANRRTVQWKTAERERDEARASLERERDALRAKLADLTTWCGEALENAKELRRQITFKDAAAHERNLELDALHVVWCDGGCDGGVHRWTEKTVTEEVVAAAERNTKRLRSWLTNHRAKRNATPYTITSAATLPGLPAARPVEVPAVVSPVTPPCCPWCGTDTWNPAADAALNGSVLHVGYCSPGCAAAGRALSPATGGAT